MPKGGRILYRILSDRRGLFRGAIATLALLLAAGTQTACAAGATFTIGWSVYAGWNPYFYMARSGLLKRWADKQREAA